MQNNIPNVYTNAISSQPLHTSSKQRHSNSSINTQPIPRATSLRPIPRTRIPTLPILHLSRRPRIAIPTITLIRILGPENLITLAKPRASLNRKRVIVVIFILDDSGAGGIRIATCIIPSGDVVDGHGTRGLVFEKIHAIAGAADFSAVAAAFHVAFWFAFGGGSGGVGEEVAAVALGAVLHAEVGVACAVGCAGGVGVAGCGSGFSG